MPCWKWTETGKLVLEGRRRSAARIELGTERESLLQVLDEDAYFGGQPAAGRSERKYRHSSFEGSQKTYNSTFSEFCSEEPCRRLGNPQMFKDTHPHLFNIAGAKDSGRDNSLASGPAPNVHGCTEPRSTSTTARKRLRPSGDSDAPYRVRY